MRCIEWPRESAGVRTIVALELINMYFLSMVMQKNVRSNISGQEEVALKKLVKIYFSFSDEQLVQAIHMGEWVEVK